MSILGVVRLQVCSLLIFLFFLRVQIPVHGARGSRGQFVNLCGVNSVYEKLLTRLAVTFGKHVLHLVRGNVVKSAVLNSVLDKVTLEGLIGQGVVGQVEDRELRVGLSRGLRRQASFCLAFV